MKKNIFGLILFLVALSGLSAQITISGILDSTVSLQAGAGDSPAFSFGIEEFANIRFQSKLRDKGTVYGAVNLIAAAGDYAANAQMLALHGASSPLSVTSYVAGQNFFAAVEIERLYFRLNGEHTDFEGGLMRMPFGYAQVWGSSDFLNPRNPLKPDARPRAVLGASLSWFPVDELKLLTFFAAPRDASARNGEGSFFGLSVDKHWEKASVQGLYSFEIPIRTSSSNSYYGLHRFGLSVKADLEIGFVMDALYTYNHDAGTKEEGLSLSAGADYSFFGGDLIVMAEYLYNGKSSSTAFEFSNNNYLYTGFTIRFNDFTNMNIALISCFDDISFTPAITFNHDLFQGAVLTITAQVPLDRDLFHNDGNRGELGPIPPDELQPFKDLYGLRGRYFNCSARIRLRF
ncbi:MAG: hypothetical protein FWB86_14295 [Treponema sp.]|nr:hypothetical protein [Treponema sp.]MCL2250557.1 hypothetical protein [Treponema sp.]